jgi:dihydrolipoamide dehydrogenase
MGTRTHDLIVIGAGPGGYVAAIRAAQLGLDVACIEQEQQLGGTCLRVGCIPSKAMLESSEKYYEASGALAKHGVLVGQLQLDLRAMLGRKNQIVRQLTGGVDFLFKKNKITRYLGTGRLLGTGRVAIEGAEPIELAARSILIATGSKVGSLPGVEFDGERVGTSTEALAWEAVPERLVVIGAGIIGLELGSVWRRLGARVTVLEYLDRILPGLDGELAAEAQKLFAKQGLEIRLGTRVIAARRDGAGVRVELEGSEPISCSHVLVAVGRVPNTDRLGLAEAGIVTDAKGRIPVDAHYQTALPAVFAIGDVIHGPMLAHKASEEGVACVERLVTGYGHVNYDAIPNVVYTEPELAAVGKTEEDLNAAGVRYRKGSFPFRAIGRAKALGHEDGRVKILADEATDRILGVHILGSRAGDLIAEAVAAIEFGASAEDLARTCHAHPTLAEAIKEAALAVQGQPIHT